MCRSISDGGQRCAAHTRPRYAAAERGTAEWDSAAAEYASTPEGRDALTALRGQATEDGDVALYVAADTALVRGESLRAVASETATEVARQNSRIVRIPNGGKVTLDEAPDREAFQPVVISRADGGSDVVYVSSSDTGPLNRPLVEAQQILDLYDAEVLTDEDEPGATPVHRAVAEWVATEEDNDMERIVLLRRTESNPCVYEHRTLDNNFFTDGGDTDDWKSYDAAFVLSRDYTGNDDNGITEDLNRAAHGRTYTIVHERFDKAGQQTSHLFDENDGTVVDPVDASARATSWVEQLKFSGDI